MEMLKGNIVSKKFKIERIGPKIFHVHTSCPDLLAMTFLRFQEHYESPKFRKKVFTLKEFRKWYKRKYGSFSYCDDWTGFNVPGWVFDTFRAGAFDPLSRKERRLLKALYRLRGDCYVIGTSKDDPTALQHEITHALFYVDPKYRAAVQKVLRKHHLHEDNAIYRWLKRNKYASAVLDDEFNAYLVNDPDYLEDEGINVNKFAKVQKKLEVLFDKYSKRNEL